MRVTLTLAAHQGAPLRRRHRSAARRASRPVESWFATTAADLARDQDEQDDGGGDWLDWWGRGGFDRVERHDDRVLLFATRLSEGEHVFSYVARATTAGTFRTAPTHAEEMYEPEVFGRTASDVVDGAAVTRRAWRARAGAAAPLVGGARWRRGLGALRAVAAGAARPRRRTSRPRSWTAHGVPLYEALSDRGPAQPAPGRRTTCPRRSCAPPSPRRTRASSATPASIPLAIARALWHDLRARRMVEGGSTITQQTVKILIRPPAHRGGQAARGGAAPCAWSTGWPSARSSPST